MDVAYFDEKVLEDQDQSFRTEITEEITTQFEKKDAANLILELSNDIKNAWLKIETEQKKLLKTEGRHGIDYKTNQI